ncbi:recombinase family protein [Rufibacter sediminis]|uniref:Recombinase family protein n=2 Tax=Rufibacter sediminis TaxID=2762756 RepID=A0ABR6VPF7_9BACT|nr:MULTISPECIES: recombinase family protein [Rufibacter]MBC3539037.1 recombinase family protein [Rufibacter sediminis]
MAKIGYARVSTVDQKLDRQVDALEKYGCEQIFQEKVTGRKADRPELTQLLKVLRKGDQLVIYKLNRLGRNFNHLIKLMGELEERGIDLVSLTDAIDTSSSMGRFIFRMFASLAELQADWIKEDTSPGLASARARGRKGGRTPGLSEKAKRKASSASKLYKAGSTITEIQEALQIRSTATIYKYLRLEGIEIKGWEKSTTNTKGTAYVNS